MLFNSLQFFIFFIIVYAAYLALRRWHRWQNRFLLIASYAFYAAWDWRFLSLLLLSTVVDYYCGGQIASQWNLRRKKQFLFLSIFVNLTVLGFFKYFYFFVDNLHVLLEGLGMPFGIVRLNIILPLGISFYTFQTMSYTIDIYYGRLRPHKGFLDFALFVSFFPQLVAGPIERARNLLPQICSPRKVTLVGFYEGCYLIFWGLFQKVFVADNLARIVDPIFSSAAPYHGGEVWLVLYAFAFQIFCDFAGYSNMARGLCKCLGFEIMVNFRLPYFAVSPQEFWKRWHISLSTWLRDYLYIPLGGNRNGIVRTCRNVMVTMLLGGLWHGASWHFVVWGAYHGVLLIVCRAWKSIWFKGIPFFIKIIFSFHLICLGWLFFRAQSMAQATQMLWAMFGGVQGFVTPDILALSGKMLFFVWFLWLVQIIQYFKKDLMAIYKMPVLIKTIFYYVSFILLLIFGVTGAKEFIYFQF